jgi:hypothetical protein
MRKRRGHAQSGTLSCGNQTREIQTPLEPALESNAEAFDWRT